MQNLLEGQTSFRGQIGGSIFAMKPIKSAKTHFF